jgi:hypothetical protein
MANNTNDYLSALAAMRATSLSDTIVRRRAMSSSGSTGPSNLVRENEIINVLKHKLANRFKHFPFLMAHTTEIIKINILVYYIQRASAILKLLVQRLQDR